MRVMHNYFISISILGTSFSNKHLLNMKLSGKIFWLKYQNLFLKWRTNFFVKLCFRYYLFFDKFKQILTNSFSYFINEYFQYFPPNRTPQYNCSSAFKWLSVTAGAKKPPTFRGARAQTQKDGRDTTLHWKNFFNFQIVTADFQHILAD